MFYVIIVLFYELQVCVFVGVYLSRVPPNFPSRRNKTHMEDEVSCWDAAASVQT